MSPKPHILIAEDDFEDRHMIAETFNELGFKSAIHFVEDGRYLVEYLTDTGAEGIGLLVLDLNMPRLNGTETLRIIKSNELYKNIPVIIFSTSVNEIEKTICMGLGANEYLTKPMKYSEFVDCCKRFYSISLAYKDSYLV